MTSPAASPTAVKRVAIVQSNYIPWKGYFDLIDSVDAFVLYDDAQYTRRDWRNRNRIKTPQGPIWLTIPVQVSGRYHQRIHEVVVDEGDWAATHWRTLSLHYRKAAGFRDVADDIEALYQQVPARLLSDINRHFIAGICRLLDITTPLRDSREFALEGDRSGKLLSICRALGAEVYVSGPAARGYLAEASFTQAGIRVEWMDYSGYPEYRQLYPPFEHQVSVLDLMFNEGHGAAAFLKRTPQQPHA